MKRELWISSIVNSFSISSVSSKVINHFDLSQVARWKVPEEWVPVWMCSNVYTCVNIQVLRIRGNQVYCYKLFLNMAIVITALIHATLNCMKNCQWTKAQTLRPTKRLSGRNIHHVSFHSPPQFHGLPLWLIVSTTVTNALSDLISKD